MSDLETKFEKASEDVQKLSQRPDNNTLLRLYAFYKQATEGNVEGKRPGITNLKGRAKYDAWAKIKDMSPEDAMTSYIDLVQSLLKG